MPKCSVISCANNSRHVRKKDGVSYFSFPRNPMRCSEWTVIIAKARNEINYKPYKGSVVCSSHFPASDIYTTTKGFSRLNKNAKPILNLSKKDSNQQLLLIEQNEESIDSSFNEDKSREAQQNEENIELAINVENEFGNNELIRTQINIACLQDSSSQIEKSLSTSLSIGSILDTPRKTVMKRKLNICDKIIQNKNRQINRLQKQNKRLIKRNTSLKNALKVLKSRTGIDESLFSQLSQNLEVTEMFNALYIKNVKKLLSFNRNKVL